MRLGDCAISEGKVATEKHSEIGDAVNDLNRLVSELDEEICALSEHISPILRPENTNACGEAGSPLTSRSPLAEELVIIGGRIRGRIFHLRAIRERVDL